jgi:hypothetical protein
MACRKQNKRAPCAANDHTERAMVAMLEARAIGLNTFYVF